MAGKPQQRGQRGGGRRGRGRADNQGPSDGLDEQLVKLYRCATVVKGGRRFSFGALVIVGDRKGRVAFGYGKANEVPPAFEKANKAARRGLKKISLKGTTIPHRVIGRFGSSRIVLIPARPGTGVIAGSAARAVLELAGVKDVLTKSYGSNSPKNLVKATLNGLTQLRTREMVERLRGVKLDLPVDPIDEPKAETSPAAAAATANEGGTATAVAEPTTETKAPESNES